MPRPNILYILADDQGYGDVGCNNPNCGAPTPILDTLAATGMRFTDAHTSSAVCTPTRYSVVTGRYNWRSALKSGVLTGESPLLVERDRATVASFLRDQGYYTACIGKWHLGLGWYKQDGSQYQPLAQNWRDLGQLREIDFSRPVSEGPNDCGFDYSFIIPSSLDIPPYVYLENGRCTAIPSEETMLGVDTPYLMRRGMAVPGMQAEDVLPTFTAKVCDTLREHQQERADQPFFLYFPLSAPHTPIVPAKEYRGRTDIGLYGDFVTQIDAIVGEVLATLDELGLREDTLVVFTSDNGASPAAKFDELVELGHEPNWPWRGAKADLYEGGHRVPFIANWPGTIAPAQVCPQTICTTDLFATAADLIDVPVPDDAAGDSVSIWPALRGDELAEPLREATVHHSISGHFALRQGPWKLLEARGSGGWSFPREEDAAGLPEVQLYNLEQDPRESMNLAAAHPEIVAELQAILDRYRTADRSV